MSYEMKCYPGDEPRIEVTEEFVKKNNFKIDFSVAKEVFNDKDDFFGFAQEVAYKFMPFEDAKYHLTKEFLEKIEKGEAKYVQITDVMEAVQDFLDYMVFAWMKANEERGISAGRSIIKLSAWMKILSRPDVADILNDDTLYAPYGKPALRKACDILGVEAPDYIR